jgi:steroid delta-isomerase-like uncharacterized protein
MSSLEKNKALILRGYEEEWNRGNLDVIPELFTKDVVCHMVHSPDIKGQDNWRVFITAFRNAFPDIQFTIEDHFGEGDKVATRWVFTGTHTGELTGIPPTGTKITVKGVNIYHFKDGKISEFWVTLDDLGMLQQLGVIPPLGQ